MLLAVLGAFAGFVWLVLVPNLLREINALASAVPGYADALVELSNRLRGGPGLVPPDVVQLEERLRDLLVTAVGSLPMVVVGIGNVALEAVAVLILALYIAYDPGSLLAGALRLFPERRRAEAGGLIRTLEGRLRGWLVGTGVAMLVAGGGAGLGLWLLGAPLPLTFGLLAGLLEVIPYFGPTVGSLLPALVALTVSPLKALLVLVLFVILHLVEAYMVQPLVMGHEVRLHPVVVILAFLFFGRLLGFVGLLLAVPAAVVLATLVDHLTTPEESSRGKEEEPDAASRT